MGTRKKQCTQCEHLGTYILENYPHEVRGESAVDVAIRLLRGLCLIKRALKIVEREIK